jgi:hypothetical protein
MPDSATLKGDAVPLALTVNVPAAVPPATGWKMTAALQLAPAARLPVQVFCVIPNGPLT